MLPSTDTKTHALKPHHGTPCAGEGAEQLDPSEAARIFEGQLANALLAEDGQLALSNLAASTVSTLMPKARIAINFVLYGARATVQSVAWMPLLITVKSRCHRSPASSHSPLAPAAEGQCEPHITLPTGGLARPNFVVQRSRRKAVMHARSTAAEIRSRLLVVMVAHVHAGGRRLRRRGGSARRRGGWCRRRSSQGC